MTIVNTHNIDSTIKAYKNKNSYGDFLPSVYVIEITNICTLNCIMCPRSKIQKSQFGHMSLNLFEKIVKEISPVAENVMLYFMGEPLLHPKFDEILKIARRWIKGKISISTNALFLNDNKIKSIISNNIDFIICCIDHYKKEKYEKIRIGSNYEIVKNNIERLISYRDDKPKPHILIKALNINFNDNEVETFHSLWRGDKITTIIGWVDTWAGQLEVYKTDISSQPYFSDKRMHCADLWFKMVINWKGDVVLCCHNFDYSIKIGSLNTEGNSLKRIWHNSEIKKIRKEQLNGVYNGICKSCSEWAKIDELDAYINIDSKNLDLIF